MLARGNESASGLVASMSFLLHPAVSIWGWEWETGLGFETRLGD